MHYSALLAQRAGFRALYLSGAGVANASDLPDLGITSLNDVCEDVPPHRRRDRAAAARRRRYRLGRRVQHRPHHGELISCRRRRACILRTRCRRSAAVTVRQGAGVGADEMVDRIKAAVDGRIDDSVRHHGAHRRACGRRAGCRDRARRSATSTAGADMIFAEALTTLDEYREFTRRRSASAREHHRVRQDAAVYDRCRAGVEVGVGLVPIPAVGVPRDEPRCGTKVYRTLRDRRARRKAWSMRCRRAPSSTKCSAITNTRETRRAVQSRHDRGLSGSERRNMSMNEPALAAPSRRSPSRCPAWPAGNTASVHRRGAPATTCTIAAMTSSRSPKLPSSRRSLTCSIHGKLPNHSELVGVSRRSSNALRGIAACGARGAGAAARRQSSDGRDANRASRRSGCVLPEKEDHNLAGARDIADRLDRLHSARCCCYWYHYSHSGTAHRGRDRGRFGRRAFPASCCTANGSRQLVGARDAYLAHSVRRARVQRLDLRRPRHRRAPDRTCIRASPARSARCAGRSTAAPTRWRFEIQERYDTPGSGGARISAARVASKEVIIGFGHPVYTISDPRNQVIKEVARRLSAEAAAT